MATYDVNLRLEGWIVHIHPTGTALAPDFVNIGQYEHPEDDVLGPEVNHVIWHHVRDLLYRAGHLDMQKFNIVFEFDPGVSPPVLVPGPLDASFSETHAEDLRTTFGLAAPNAVLMVATRYTGSNPPDLSATHGGEALIRVQRSVHPVAKIVTAIFYGTGLTEEEAELVIASNNGANMGPAPIRIQDDLGFTDMAQAGLNYRYGTGNGLYGVDLPGFVENSIVKTIIATEGVSADFLPQDEENTQTYMNRVFAGSDVFEYVPDNLYTLGSFVYDEETGVFTKEGTMNYAAQANLPDGFYGPIGIEVDVDIPAGSTLRVNLYIGSTTNSQLLVGPMEGKVFILNPGVKAFTRCWMIPTGPCSFSNMKVYKEALELSASFYHTSLLEADPSLSYLSTMSANYNLISAGFHEAE